MAEQSTVPNGRSIVGAPDAAHMRRVLGRVPTSVSVVTTLVEGVPAGSVVGTFTSVSLDPPLAAFFSQPSSEMLAAVRKAGTFSVNVLAADQESTCRVFSAKSSSRFDAVDWRRGPRGNPRLTGSLAALECVVEAVTEVGDHVMVLGHVVELDELRQDVDPLVFWGGAFHGLQDTTPDQPQHRSSLSF